MIALQKRLDRFLPPLQFLPFLFHDALSAQELRHVIQSSRQQRKQLDERLRLLHDGDGGCQVPSHGGYGLDERREDLGDTLHGMEATIRPVWIV